MLCRVRGYKHVMKLFPHDVSHFEACMRMLNCQDTKDYNNWESRYILILWLCMLCIIPFDICSMDSSLTLNSTSDSNLIVKSKSQSSSLVHNIISLSLSCLSDPGPTRDAGSACLSTLLTRPDMDSGMLTDFIESAVNILRDWTAKSDDEVKDLTSS